MSSICVPWTIFFVLETSEGVSVENVLAPHSPPVGTLFFDKDNQSWSRERTSSSVQVLGAVKGWHQSAAFAASRAWLEPEMSGVLRDISNV